MTDQPVPDQIQGRPRPGRAVPHVGSARERPLASDQSQMLKTAMAAFPSGVTIVTTVDGDGRPRGFTATAFTSVSADPPLVLSCLAKTAQCFQAFATAERWVVHVIAEDQTELAKKFATRGVDKFEGESLAWLDSGLPMLLDAATVIECSAYAQHDGGDHLILVGRVDDVVVNPTTPAVYYRRAFHRLTSEPVGASA